MQPYLRKLRKLKRSKPSSLEESVAKTLFELETSHKTLRQELPRFHINSAREVKVPRSKKTAMVVFYPLRFLMLVRKVQRALTSASEPLPPSHVSALCHTRNRRLTPSLFPRLATGRTALCASSRNHTNIAAMRRL
ncbi:putative Ribosomal protein S7e, partial [Leishmania utingensis]